MTCRPNARTPTRDRDSQSAAAGGTRPGPVLLNPQDFLRLSLQWSSCRRPAVMVIPLSGRPMKVSTSASAHDGCDRASARATSSGQPRRGLPAPIETLSTGPPQITHNASRVFLLSSSTSWRNPRPRIIDLEADVHAFKVRCPRLHIIDIDDFDPCRSQQTPGRASASGGVAAR